MDEPSIRNRDASEVSFSLGPRLALPIDPTQVRTGTPIVAVHFDDAGKFLRAVEPDRGDAGEVAIATRANHPNGSEVVLEIRWPDLPNRVYLRARAERSTWTGRRIFQVSPSERVKLEYLVASARGVCGEVTHRSHRRYCVRLPAQWRPFGAREMYPAIAEDLSAAGARIVSPIAPVDVGERVVVRVQAEALGQDLVLTGRVRHFHHHAWNEVVVGVVFEHRSSGEQRNLRCMLHAFAAKGIVLFDELAEAPGN